VALPPQASSPDQPTSQPTSQTTAQPTTQTTTRPTVVKPVADDTLGPDGEPVPPVESGVGADAPRRLSRTGTVTLGVALLAELFVCLAVLVSIWSPLSDLTAQQSPRPQTAPWYVLGLGPWQLSATTAMLLVVLGSSGLGSFVHAATSFATYVGNRRLYSSWMSWYLLRTGIGAALALLVYFLLRGGLFANGTDTAALNPYGFAGIAGLCGLFSKQATDKLREVFDTILTTSDGAGDDERRDSATDPAPTAAGNPTGTAADELA